MAEKHLSDTYLSHAVREREWASEAPNLNIRAMHERSAEKWDELAIRQMRVENRRPVG